MAVKGASFANYPEGQTVFGLGGDKKLYPLPIGDGYSTVAASQANQVLGATGAAGDYLAAVLIIPATTSPGAVSIKDGANAAITIFPGGATSVADLKPFWIPLGLRSTVGAWQIATGANVTAIGTGIFT
jgi:hypothetical protein